MISYKEALKKKIEEKTAIVGVVGLGYVGLPLAVAVAGKGFQTIGFDIQKKRTEMVNRGENYIGDVDEEELRRRISKKKLRATTDYAEIGKCDVICIAVPTPLDKYKQPDERYVLRSSKDIARAARKGALVILESTTYPGTTEEVVAPIFRKQGFTVGEDLYLAFSPERVDPGNPVYKTANTPKIVGGMSDSCSELSSLFYTSVLDAPVTTVSSPKVAEMEKILENTFRNINIGLVNEMAILCDKMGIDIWEVIRAASTKPYGYMTFYPGPGIGGHCIPIDPFYLTWKAREYDYHTRLIETSSEINNYMPEFVVERVFKMLNRHGKPMNGARILILGTAYKKNIGDLRESPALTIISILEKNGALISYNDPFVPSFRHQGKIYASVELTEDEIKKADLLLLITDHDTYDADFLIRQKTLLFDTRNLTRGVKSPYVERL
ncbi:nucleotide sugar dehydrogenase [Candidatus Mcinerneyibacteriota bacterium]|nr:nucleotide sugar dehydrogenase [Candidatus Mcinerneyibacteriota bacterium]